MDSPVIYMKKLSTPVYQGKDNPKHGYFDQTGISQSFRKTAICLILLIFYIFQSNAKCDFIFSDRLQSRLFNIYQVKSNFLIVQ